MLPVIAVVALALLATDVPPPAAEEGYQLIVNSSNPGASIQRDAAAAIFMGTMTRWKDNRPIAPVDQSTRTTVRAAFSTRVLKKPVMAVQFYWGQKLVSGHGTPPPVKGSDEEVADFVRDNSNAIGYVSTSFTVGDGLRVLKIVD
jgi:ABC-type phosphate transport system substrate-binding protein